jgi:hypothetical protein
MQNRRPHRDAAMQLSNDSAAVVRRRGPAGETPMQRGRIGKADGDRLIWMNYISGAMRNYF